MVDEHTRELVADGFVHEQCGHRRVDAAREPADHPAAPDLRADPLDLLLDHGRGCPRRRRARDLVEEVLQQVLAVRRVHDLRMELHAVQRLLVSSKAAIGVEGEPATIREPSGER